MLPTTADVMGWNHQKLLEWLQSQNPVTLEEPTDLEAFKASRIGGDVFLHEKTAFFRSCGISLGVARRLELLAERISTSRKRERELDELEKRNFHHESKHFAECHMAVQQVSTTVETYCNPSICQKLPFMFIGAVPKDRFLLDEDLQFQYYGRERFQELYDAARSMRYHGTRKYFLHGTLGSGKSYLLAALACLLTKQGMKVVYLPDCGEMMGDAFEYLRAGLRLAFTGSAEHDALLANCEDTKGLLKICSAVSSEYRLLFIVDQVNALDPGDEVTDRFSLDMKRSVRTLLDTITAKHMKISSSSGNYLHAIHDRYRQTGESRIYLYGGLNKIEMEKWWSIHQDKLALEFRDEDRTEMEDMLGNLPILLDVLSNLNLDEVKDEASKDSEDSGMAGEIYLQQLAQLYDKLWNSTQVKMMIATILSFANHQCEKLRDSQQLLIYRNTLSACLTEGAVADDAESHLDWRYFYAVNGVGKSTSGIARMVGARFLRRVVSASDFLTPNWYDSLRLAGSNPSVLGFFTEQMLLSWISEMGCPNAGVEFSSKPTVVVFQGSRPHISHKVGFSLYIPTSFNFRAVDAVMVSLNETRTEAVVVGVQITLSNKHSDSEARFLHDWQWWELVLDCLKVSFRFMWVVEDATGKVPREDIEVGYRLLRGENKVWRPTFTRSHITVESISKDIGAKLQGARAKMKISR